MPDASLHIASPVTKLATSGIALTVAVGVSALLLFGLEPEGWKLAARWTAWAACAFFLLLFLVPLTRGLPSSLPMRGLLFAFVAAHVVHLAFLAVNVKQSKLELDVASWVVGGLAYALVIASPLIDADRRPRVWTIGLWYVWLVFTLTFAQRLSMPGREVAGAVGTTVMLAAAATWLLLFIRRRHG